MSTRPETGLSLIEMVVTLVLTALLMAMAAPLLVHLFASYTVSAQGADLASAAGPAVARLQWDARNAYLMQLSAPCTLDMYNDQGVLLTSYSYARGQLFRNNVLLLGDIQAATCPFGASSPSYPYVVTYSFRYAGPGGGGQFPVYGEVAAYAY